MDEQAVAEVKTEANRIIRELSPRKLVDRDDDKRLVLLVATLFVAGVITQDMIQQSLESVDRKRSKGERFKTFAYFRGCIRKQCESAGLDLHELERNTKLPDIRPATAEPTS